MTYADRIEAIARAMVRHDVSETMAGRADLEAAFGKRWAEESEAYENLARAADRACLKAIEEPTEEMVRAGLRFVADADMNDHGRERWRWRRMHKAIPRGE